MDEHQQMSNIGWKVILRMERTSIIGRKSIGTRRAPPCMSQGASTR